jgi:hypothetical protein
MIQYLNLHKISERFEESTYLIVVSGTHYLTNIWENAGLGNKERKENNQNIDLKKKELLFKRPSR